MKGKQKVYRTVQAREQLEKASGVKSSLLQFLYVSMSEEGSWYQDLIIEWNSGKSKHIDHSEQIEQLQPTDKVLMVCDNGRTRSKYAAQIANEMGFDTQVLGIKDYTTRDDEKIQALQKSALIVTLAPDIKPQIVALLNRYLQPEEIERVLSKIIEVFVSEKLHYELNGVPQQIKEKGKQELKTILTKAGFKPTTSDE